jgi:hypothetical protein
VLALAAAAGKMVIATDGGLIGRRVHAHQLGLCFTPGSTRDLARTIAAAETMLTADPRRFAAAARRFAKGCDRKAFARVLGGIYPSPKNAQERDHV